MSAANDLVRQVSLMNPLPWTIEQDWTWEVTAANGVIVAKCRTPGDAQAVVALGQRLHAKREADALTVEADLEVLARGEELPQEQQPAPDVVDMFNTLERMPMSAARVAYAQSVREELERLVRG